MPRKNVDSPGGAAERRGHSLEEDVPIHAPTQIEHVKLRLPPPARPVQGTPLTDALVNVHSIEPVEAPTGPSLIGLDSDDEDYDPELDDLDATAATDYCWVEATIAPHDLEAEWDPGILFLVPHDFEPEE